MTVFRPFIGALALCFCAPAALAQGGLLDQGKSILEGLQGGGKPAPGGLSTATIADGLKEALRVGSERVVGQLGRAGAFAKGTDVHIPLPGSLATVQKALSRVGMSGLADDLESRINRAAEKAVPEAKAVFWDAISQMTLDDVQKIYKGPGDAATRYLQSKMSAPLSDRFRPIVDRQLADAGAVAAYDKMMAQYKSIPFVPDAKAELNGYVVDQSLAAIFSYLAREEKAIRENPAKRSTELLRKVFGK